MRNKHIDVLLIEDDPAQTRLIQEMINEAGDHMFYLESTDRLSKGLDCFNRCEIDAVLLDLNLPDSSGINTFIRVCTRVPKVPIIVLGDHDDETIELKVIQKKAQDYLVRGQIGSKLLVRSIRHAIERQKLICKLQEANEKTKILHGFLPICAGCKKIRDDKGFWIDIEGYISDHSEADFTHSCCPECMKVYYPKFTKV